MKLTKNLPALTNQHLVLLLAFYSFGALVAAYVSQFVFDYQPCVLCLYQRIPFFAVVLVALVVVFFLKNEKAKNLALWACLGILLINVGIASYHVGVEKKFFRGPTTCTSNDLSEIENLEELKKAIEVTKAVPCDKPAFVFWGLSMAAWNLAYCLLLIGLTLVLKSQVATPPLQSALALPVLKRWPLRQYLRR